MPRAGMGTFKCPKCERSFSMKAHLARHLSTIHATAGQKAAKAAARPVGRPPGPRPVGRPPGPRPVGRPKGLTARLGLRDMSLEELREVIDAARDEARVKLAEYQSSFL